MIRLRFRELLDARGLTPYHLAKQSEGRISLSTAYRYQQLNGAVKSFDAAVLEALCDVLDVNPGELLVRDSDKKARRRQP